MTICIWNWLFRFFTFWLNLLACVCNFYKRYMTNLFVCQQSEICLQWPFAKPASASHIRGWRRRRRSRRRSRRGITTVRRRRRRKRMTTTTTTTRICLQWPFAKPAFASHIPSFLSSSQNIRIEFQIFHQILENLLYSLVVNEVKIHIADLSSNVFCFFSFWSELYFVVLNYHLLLFEVSHVEEICWRWEKGKWGSFEMKIDGEQFVKQQDRNYPGWRMNKD